MGFSLTEEQDEVVCAKDVKAGRITDRFLAPAISRFATDTWSMNKQTAGVRRKVEDLHQRWGKTNAISNTENFKAQADNEAKVTKKFIRIIQRKDLQWEKDSIARAANDPEHVPDCNVKATVGQHFLFHEPIPKAINGQGYLRVTTKSLWWQHGPDGDRRKSPKSATRRPPPAQGPTHARPRTAGRHHDAQLPTRSPSQRLHASA